MKLIDTHAHLNFVAYNKDRDKIIRKTLKEDIWMINVGTNYQTSKEAVDISKKYTEGVFASIGLHPINLDTGLLKMRHDKQEVSEDFSFEKDFDYKKYAELILEGGEKVVAIGEIGFDYWYRPKSKKKREEFKGKQKKLFRKQVKLAEEFELPLILHCRLGYDDLIEELSKIKYKFGGVLHCFCGKWNEAEKILELGYYLGFNGIIFKMDLDEIIKKAPLERILVETDCPFLTPPLPTKTLGKLGMIHQRNEPVNVKYIAEKIAKIKKIKVSEVEKVTTENAMKLFGISSLF